MDFIKELGYLAIASRMKRLTDRLMKGGQEAYRSLGIDFEPRWFSVFYLIFSQDIPLSISDIAASLKISHPAVIQTSQMLLKKGLIESFQDRKDRRIRRLIITQKGKDLANFLLPVWNDFVAATAEMFENADVDMLAVIERIEGQLDEEDTGKRIIKKIKERQYHSVEILDFAPEYQKYFKELNYEWLEKYFTVEDQDRKMLLDPQREILDRGGFILFARLEDEIIGTTAVLKADDETYEIAKMAVAGRAQGKQVGLKLTDEAIARAREKGGKKILLKTDNRLRSAVNLYRKSGFRIAQAQTTATGKYNRERFGIVMSLDLTRASNWEK
jgi:ribosomal protein S18 acetylase RimI-like enzyme/predicted transcriptional regulator